MAYQNTGYKGRGLKRRIEKVWSRFQITMQTSISDEDLHTVEDNKTLVRMRGVVSFLNTGGGSRYDVIISVCPADTTLENPSVSQSLDNDDSKYTLLRYNGQFVTGSLEPVVWNIDSKAMRKLNPGDVLKVRCVSNTANEPTMRGTLTMWFKE